jgi:SAM-dependent methyltransferase
MRFRRRRVAQGPAPAAKARLLGQERSSPLPAGATAGAALRELLAGPVAGVDRTIHPDDGMFDGDGEHYFSVGESALRSIRLAMVAAGVDEPKRILDLPCGYGRVMRILRAAFPEAEIAGCDLLAEGVEFCRRTFGSTSIRAAERPEEIDLGGTYDLIWCGSLVTHLEAERWEGFLRLFASALAPRIETGVDTYGLGEERAREVLDVYAGTGFGYAEYPTIPGYGISVSSPSWVATRLERLSDLRIVFFEERAWDAHHDIVAVARVAVPADGRSR